ncbi:MAG: D-alanyl-D-alanine carboxypeptidase/D-alanyl-D-alanine-endopeptidase [Deltaproteobacteria bacterium]|nr:D-alanyl-D-alanine carboxypeptidase/D-alanyl-D-alanine-endopeptidase [Deltaproteobacteria bacterium]
MKQIPVLLLIAFSLISGPVAWGSSRHAAVKTPPKKTVAQKSKTAPKKVEKPAETPRSLANSGLSPREQIQALTSQHSAEDVQYGILIRDLETGQVLYAKDEDLLLNPASNTKVLTTLAALASLGPDYTFKTQVLGTDGAAKGRLESLTLKGFGDPMFTSERLDAMVQKLRDSGLRQVDRVFIDGSYFDGEDFPGQMEGRQRDASFNCSVGAISIDHNLLELSVAPGEKSGDPAVVEAKPALPNLPIEEDIKTIKGRGRVIVKNTPGEEQNLSVSVTGGISLKSEPQTYKLSIHHPLQLAGLRFLAALQAQGIQAPSEVSFVPAPPKAKVLAESNSPPLSEILQEINKHSDNFMAEMLTKALGASFAGLPGTTTKGVSVVLKKLKELGIRTEGISMENGSGLSKKNRLRAETLAEALQKAYSDPKLRVDFISSLSVLGVDGTLKRKFRHSDLAGRFLGKTGTLNGVSALSGYVFPKNSEKTHPYVYSFIVNGTGKNFWKEKQLAQDILETLLNL